MNIAKTGLPRSTVEPALSPETPESLSNKRNIRPKLAAGILVLAALIFSVYYPALRTQLVADDFYLVGQLSFADAATYFTKTFGLGRNEYRPVTALSFATDRWLWHKNPEGYHLTNLLLYFVTAGLLFLILHALTADLTLALLASCLFAIHPINNSRVTWISARDGPVCSVFLLGAFWLFVLSRQQNRTSLRAMAVILAGCALLAYEGAVILPALIFVAELLFFRSGPLGSRIGPSLRQTAAFWILVAGYVCFWEVTFSGKIGAYDLTLTPLNILENYGRLLSTLFYGHRRLVFGLAYLVLLVLGYRMLKARSRLTALAAALILVSFVPYCFTNGFAFRFGYLSSLGMAIILAACLEGGIRSERRSYRILAACLGVILCAYYVDKDRKILAQWTAAGEICARIPQAVRKYHPNLPKGTVLVFVGVPREHGVAYVFPTGLDAAIQRQYPVKVTVRQYDVGVRHLPATARHAAYVFVYRGGKDPLLELSPDKDAQP